MRWTAGFLEIMETSLADEFDMRSITTGALSNEPQHVKTNKIICAGSLIRVYAVRMKKGLVSGKHKAHGENNDQTGRMPRLI